jgi:penicillin-binding protein 2
MLYDADRAIANQYTAKPIIAANVIRARLYEIGEARGITYEEERVEAATKALLDLVTLDGNKSVWYPLIRQILIYDLGIPQTYISSHYLVNEFTSYLNDLRWTANETIMVAIGQSITQVTPVAVARYVSAIANGGTVYDAQIVSKVIDPNGNIVLEKEPVVANQITTEDIYFEKIKEGMNSVASPEEGGTAAEQFKGWKYTDVLCVKTGTSERTELDVENNSWMVAFAPIDDPKIVVVSYIQNGYAGSLSGPIIREIIGYYLDSLEYTESTTVEHSNSLAD